jgi:hypothetical protein
VKFVLKDLIRKPPKFKGQVLFRFYDAEMSDAFKRMLHDSALPAQQVLERMVRHCLVEAGFLKEPTPKEVVPHEWTETLRGERE